MNITDFRESLTFRPETQKQKACTWSGDFFDISFKNYIENCTNDNNKKDRPNLMGSPMNSYKQAGIRSYSCRSRIPKKKVPYGHLADENGVIAYNGVVFTCDEKTNSICLGDMSNAADVLTIPLSEGGCLKVNRNNFGDLASAILMFSPEDRNRIMRAISQDHKVQEMKQRMEDKKADVVQLVTPNAD